MNSKTTHQRRRPTATTWLAGSLVLGGALLAVWLSPWFLLLVALGTFGPGVLREAGWLRDKDELQLLAAHRAGYHAYLASGIAAFASLAYFQSVPPDVRDARDIPLLFLALVWCTWFLSALLSYWGPQKTAVRILTAFGTFWIALMIINSIRLEWSGWGVLLMQLLPAVPLFALGWASPRWPRATGMLLLVTAAFTLLLLAEPAQNDTGLVMQILRVLLFIGPLLACGVSLLSVRSGDDDDEVDDALVSGQR